MKNQWRLFILCVQLFGILTCSREKYPVEPSQELLTKLFGIAVRTDKSQYGVNDTIRFTVSNYSQDTVHVAACCANIVFGIEIWQNGSWQKYAPQYNGLCIALCRGWLDFAAKRVMTQKFFWRDDDLPLIENETFRIEIECWRNSEHFWAKSNAFLLRR